MRDRLDKELDLAGVTVAPAVKRNDPGDPFELVPSGIQTLADQAAESFMRYNEDREMPLLSKILLPDAQDKDSAAQRELMKERLSDVIQRLAVSVQRDRAEAAEKAMEAAPATPENAAKTTDSVEEPAETHAEDAIALLDVSSIEYGGVVGTDAAIAR